MPFNKIVISSFLLLIYSLGFAHNFVPHCNDDVVENTFEHEHHEHPSEVVQDEEGEHAHIQHLNHYDENLFDIVLCVISDEEHGESECELEHCFIPNSTQISIKDISKLKFLVLFLSPSVETDKKETRGQYYISTQALYHSPSIESSPLRGPPIISC